MKKRFEVSLFSIELTLSKRRKKKVNSIIRQREQIRLSLSQKIGK